MYELMKPERSIHHRLASSEEALALPSNERLLDAALRGPEAVRRELAAQQPAPVACDRNGRCPTRRR
jgi:hypothetical protein